MQYTSTSFLGQGLYFLVQQGIDIKIATDITLGCLTLAAVLFPAAGIIANRFGRRLPFVYLSIVHLAVMGVIGFLGFKKGSTAAGWVSPISRFIL